MGPGSARRSARCPRSVRRHRCCTTGGDPLRMAIAVAGAQRRCSGMGKPPCRHRVPHRAQACT
eukprot:3240736-Prorocentrum_lima.AAC.1